MAAKQKNRNRKSVQSSSSRKRWHDDLEPQTKKSVTAVLFFALAAITLLAYWGRAGFLGRWIFDLIYFAFGRAYFIAPLTAIAIGFSLLFSFRQHLYAATFVGAGLGMVSALAVVDLIFGEHSGGYVGFLANYPLVKVFDFWAALVIEVSILLVAGLIMANLPLWKPQEERAEEEDKTPGVGEGSKVFEAVSETLTGLKSAVSKRSEAASGQNSKAVTVDAAKSKSEEAEEFVISSRRGRSSGYRFPPLDLLNDDRGTPSSGDIRANANIIKRTLLNFGIDVEMGEVSVGPTVTQYTLKPAEGVKLSRILPLSNDLALALAAHPIRIEAPIPGKSLVGVEVPNRSIALVGLRSLLENDIFQSSNAPLLFSLGRDVAGAPVYANLSRMPHLLVAGSTGSGKSVMLHAAIISFLYRNPPELLRFLIIDPKRVELSTYQGIPHLLTPPITDGKKTIQALRWAVKEMERRYEDLSREGVRDIAGFNERAAKKNSGSEFMPYLVVVIDELADLMVAYPREVEGSIVRLAQMARAVGIHLVVSTQRPSVEVITGLIKANITSRIAFQVASQVDSRTILDVAGAEKLLGNGDMLFLSGDTAKPRRIQAGFVSPEEVERVVEFIREQGVRVEAGEEIFGPDSSISQTPLDFEEGVSDEEDPFYEEAKRLVIEARKASASYLQRRLKIGYARAARLLDILEERGVIGPGEGAKPREVFIREFPQET